MGGDQTQSELNPARSRLTNNAQLTRLASYNYVDTTGCQFTEGFFHTHERSCSNGFIVITHGYPGFEFDRLLSLAVTTKLVQSVRWKIVTFLGAGSLLLYAKHEQR